MKNYFEKLLGILSVFMITSGLLNLLGDDPYAHHLIIVGIVGLILAFLKFIFIIISLGFPTKKIEKSLLLDAIDKNHEMHK